MPISFAWVGLIDWKKILLKGLPYFAAIVAVIGLGWHVYSLGSKHGAAKVNAAWNVEKLANEKALTKLRDDAAHKEFIHQQESQRISDDLADANQKYAASIASIRGDYAQRLSNSEQRAAYYQRVSATGTVEQRNLASHAAELDRSLEEGRQLVQELSATVRQRDSQLVALGQQILADRSLTGEKDGQTSAPTK